MVPNDADDAFKNLGPNVKYCVAARAAMQAIIKVGPLKVDLAARTIESINKQKIVLAAGLTKKLKEAAVEDAAETVLPRPTQS